MYSPRAQSHTRWLTMLARPFRIRLKPAQKGWETSSLGGDEEIQTTEVVVAEQSTSVDGEVLHRHRGCDVSNVDELLLTDASRHAAHVLGLPVQSEKL